MTVRQPCYSKEEFARCGDEIDQIQIAHRLRKGIRGRLWRLAHVTLQTTSSPSTIS
jgi:hypothetical protein